MTHMVFLSTLPARGATCTATGRSKTLPRISIHAPREGSDISTGAAAANDIISIHAPREGSDVKPALYHFRGFTFLSTLPARGATEE